MPWLSHVCTPYTCGLVAGVVLSSSSKSVHLCLLTEACMLRCCVDPQGIASSIGSQATHLPPDAVEKASSSKGLAGRQMSDINPGNLRTEALHLPTPPSTAQAAGHSSALALRASGGTGTLLPTSCAGQRGPSRLRPAVESRDTCNQSAAGKQLQLAQSYHAPQANLQVAPHDNGLTGAGTTSAAVDCLRLLTKEAGATAGPMTVPEDGHPLPTSCASGQRPGPLLPVVSGAYVQNCEVRGRCSGGHTGLLVFAARMPQQHIGSS